MDPYETTLRKQIEADRGRMAQLSDELRTIKIRLETREADLRAYLATKGDEAGALVYTPPSAEPADAPLTVGQFLARAFAANALAVAAAGPPVPPPEARRAAYLQILGEAPPDGYRANVIRTLAAHLLNGFEPTPDMFSRDMDSARDDGVVQSPTKGYWRLVQPQLPGT